MATKKQRLKAQQQATAMQAEASMAQLISGSDAPVAPKTVAASAPGTSSKTVDLPNTQYVDLTEQEAVSLISGKESVTRSSGIAGTEIKITPSGQSQLVYTGSGKPVEPGTPAPLPPTPPAPPPPVEDAILKIAANKLAQYNLTGIADALKRARADYPELEVTDLLFIVENDTKYNQPFRDRFKANAAREAKGLPKMSAADYLEMEQGYQKLFRVYNLPMFSNQSQYDKLIAGDVDIDDATDRVVKAYDRVISDKSTRNAFTKFYGSLTDSDIVSALLDPEQQVPALEKKIVAAEIGGQALRQGLATSLAPIEAQKTAEGKQVSGYSNVQRGSLGAEALAGEGVTESAAASAYQDIAEQLPAAEKLSSLYAGRTEKVGQVELEQAEILRLASARRKQQRIAGMEAATFAGESGVSQTSLGRRGSAGSF